MVLTQASCDNYTYTIFDTVTVNKSHFYQRQFFDLTNYARSLHNAKQDKIILQMMSALLYIRYLRWCWEQPTLNSEAL
jgi:hypothetical protein